MTVRGRDTYGKIPYTSKLAYAEDGRTLALDYSVLANSGKCEFEQYGVKILEKNSGEQALAFNLTVSTRRIYELMDKLAQGSGTPTGLEDVLADWI